MKKNPIKKRTLNAAINALTKRVSRLEITYGSSLTDTQVRQRLHAIEERLFAAPDPYVVDAAKLRSENEET